MTLLEEAIEAWTYTRRGLLAEAEIVPDDGYAYRPHPESRSLAELLLHVAASGLLMAGELSRPDGDFQRKSYQELMEEHAARVPEDASPTEIRALLTETLDGGTARLRAAGQEHMLGPIRRFDGERASRLAWMYHGIAHEEYHRGQVALYVRMQGIVPALTRAIQGSDAE